jgi:hypothetical protein
MLKFTSISDSDFRVITDITLTVTIIRTGITTDLITARTTGTVGIAITGIGIIPIIMGASLIRRATPGWLEVISSQPDFFGGNSLEIQPNETRRSIFLTLGKPPV